MDIADKQRHALASLLAFQTNPPSFWDENAVSQFNEVVTSLEEAFEIDLSSSRIPDAELRPRVVSSRRASYSGRFPASKQMSQTRYCDEKLAQRKIDGIVFYFQNLQPTPKRPKIGF
jgi:hypothetical protein